MERDFFDAESTVMATFTNVAVVQDRLDESETPGVRILEAPGRNLEVLEAITNSGAEHARPLLLTGGTVVTMNPVIGDWEAADVLVVGSVVVGVGPGLLTAAADDKSIVIDCRGTIVLPAGVDFISPNTSGTLRPGAPANIAVVRLADLEGTPKGATVGKGGSWGNRYRRRPYFQPRYRRLAPDHSSCEFDHPG